MKTKLRAGISVEDLFLLKIKYGTGEVDAGCIDPCDHKYFEKLDRQEIYDNIDLITAQMGTLLDFDSFNGDMWDRVLRVVPEFAEYCDWDKLCGLDWSYLLRKQPQFAEHCDWSKLSRSHWEFLLQVQPQLAKYRK